MRFLFLVLIATAITCLAYPFTGDYFFFVDSALWIYSLTIAFLIDKAMVRRATLKENINIELARLRHIHHVAEQLGKTFSKKIDALLIVYEKRIAEEFLSHHATTEDFRKLSHAIYSFSPKTQKDGILFADLLQTLQEITLGRQSIQCELKHRLAFYDWFLISVVLVCLLVLMLVPIEAQTPNRHFVLMTMAILVNLIPMEMLWKSDRYSHRATKKFQTAYAKNVPKD